jgi:uncharacterized membrane protein
MLSTLKDWLVLATGFASVVIDFIALIIVVIDTVEAAVGGGLRLVSDSSAGYQRRGVWLSYARWLVAALTFQLAADIIETSIAPTWDDVGRLAVIAVVRTLLNYFLEKDVEDIRDRQRETS